MCTPPARSRVVILESRVSYGYPRYHQVRLLKWTRTSFVCASLPTFLLCSVLRLPRLSDLCPALQGKHTNSEPRADDATHGRTARRRRRRTATLAAACVRPSTPPRPAASAGRGDQVSAPELQLCRLLGDGVGVAGAGDVRKALEVGLLGGVQVRRADQRVDRLLAREGLVEVVRVLLRATRRSGEPRRTQRRACALCVPSSLAVLDLKGGLMACGAAGERRR